MTDNINKNNNQHNDVIENDQKFDNKFSLSNRTKYSQPVVTISLIGGKEYRATMINGLICLWDSGSTNIMIKIKHAKHYEGRIQYNKVECSTVAGPYCMTHNGKVIFLCQSYLAAR